ncbi:MAG: DUF1080 domain-containing protein [Planctomycetales bacterium]|nr:DUF1080 domain-containing protein [Planctomycetales bacterium]
MRSISLRFAVIIATAFGSVHLQARAESEEFKPLFNGKNLDGWRNINCAPETWSVRDGMIYCTGAPIGELRTDRMYQNFVLELEWRHLKPKGNAGVFVWADAITAQGQPFHRGVEVQVLDGRESEYYTSDGDIFPIHGAVMTPENGRGGSRAFPTEKRSNPSPEWNHYRIECMDGSISLAVNGKVVTKGHDASPRKGYICLESEGSPVEFRNLRIKELPSSELSNDKIANVDEGFESLYNGMDLRGWKTHEGLIEHWKPNDWRLEYDGNATGDDKNLWSEESFEDFELIVDWRWNGEYKETTKRPVVIADGTHEKNADGSEKTIDVPVADSGIYLRGSSKAQINIWQWPIGSGEIWGYRTDEDLSNEIRAAATPLSKADLPIGKWNRFHITMVGEHVTVKLNGKTVIERCHLPGIPASGPIALQHHGDPIEFANIYVKRLAK